MKVLLRVFLLVAFFIVSLLALIVEIILVYVYIYIYIYIIYIYVIIMYIVFTSPLLLGGTYHLDYKIVLIL